MTHIIVVANQKGGVGKTTIVVHLAFHFMQKGKVCLVDLDSQGNAGGTFDGEHESPIVASQLFGTDLLDIPEPDGQISVITADGELADVEGIDIEAIQNPSKHLQGIGWADFIIIDTPPALGRRLLSALIAADHVLAPIEPTGYAIDGLGDLLGTIEMVKDRFNPDLNFLGVLPNKVHAVSKNQKEFMRDLFEELEGAVIPQMLGNRVAVADAVDTGRPVWEIMSRGGKQSGKEFKAVFRHIEERMGLIQENKEII